MLFVPVEHHDCMCVAFCICGFVCKWLHIPLYSLLGFSVSWLHQFSGLLHHICHNFHFLEQCGDPSVKLEHCIMIASWKNFGGLTPNLVLLNNIKYVLLSSDRECWQGPHKGHRVLCCLWVWVMFIMSIPVNLIPVSRISSCVHFSSVTFYRTMEPSHKAWYWNHGLRWQTSCGK